ncbi:MAG: HmuY family protein [Bacteroides sp.]|nr:HmuY family protein [Bacteroides sp.]
MNRKFSSCLAAGAAMTLLTACDGILGGIYDEPATEAISDYGFISAATATEPGKIYIDATDYTKWVYIDFTSRRVETVDVNDPAPDNWAIAVHRYDTKTNNDSVIETGATGFSSIGTMVVPDLSNFVSDTWTTTTIVTDMSTMMDGYLSYAESFYNPELSKWLDVDTGTMPPIYTQSNKVYIVRLNDGSLAGVKLENYMDGIGVKGYMTIRYMYPLNL